MKKNLQFRGLFIALFAMMWSFALQAQTWTAPTLTGSTLTTGTTYYVYNVGSNGYLTRGGTYLTQAVVTAQPRLNASTSIIKWTATNTGGSIWTFQYNLAAANVASNFLFPSNASSADGSVYTDNTTNDTWNVVQTDAPNKIYSIQVVSGYGGYSATQYVGSAAAAEVNNATSGGASGTSNVIRYNRTASTYTQWKFVAQTDLDLYNAKILLDRYMTYAKNRGIDISSYITTYNAGVTANITTAASTLLTALSRTTISFTNSSFESATAAAQTSMTGWTSSGGFQTQNSSPSTGFTKGGTYFVEKYIASAYGTSGSGTKAYLAAGTVTQSVSSLSSGLYELVVAGHAVQQAGANPLHTGAFITAGALSTEVCAGQDYSIENINVTGTSLTVGYSLAGTITCNWTAFDNYRLYYYGAIVPNIAVSKTSFDLSALPYSTTFDIVGGYLSADITLTPPNHITLSGTNVVNNGDGTFKILAANANITNTVTATWDGTVSVATSNIVMASGAASKNIAVSATIVPSILASKTNLSYSTSTNTGTFDITGANITSDITISVPTGITLSGTYVTGSAPTYTIVLANANAVNTVTTTWGKANNIASGTITVASSGATSKTVAITTTSDVETSTLSNIALSTGILNPVFATGTTSYSVKVPANVSSVTVTGTASSSVASISNNATAISNGTPSVVLGCSSYNTLNTTNYTVNWGGNYTFADWAANGSTDAILSLPSVYGWSATPAIGWIAANGSTAGTCRYFDYVNGVNGTNPTYTYSGSNYTGRAMLMRWDGTGNAARVYSYPVKLETCKTYSLTGKANWHGTATVPTLTYRINSANDNTGTTYATGTAVTTTVGTFIDAGISTITVPTTGVYYLTITSSTQALCAIADLSLTTNVSESLTSSQTSLSFDTNNTSRTFTITGNSLTNDVTLSAPTGITLDKTSISAADAQCGVTVTATYDKSATIRGGSITATSGILTQNITVNASADNLCYTPLYSSRTNIISDTYFNSLSAYSLSWGNAALTTDPSLVYCGLNSAVITGTNAGSFAYPLTGKWAVNTTYRVKAKVNVTSGTFQLSISGWFGAAADIVNTIPTTSGWQDVDFTFATGSVINSANQLVYFNNFGLGAGIGYIDNLEMYAIPSTSISTTNLSFDLSNTSRTFTVTGVELTSDVTLTPPTGIALDKTTIAFADANSGAQTVTATWDQTHTVTAQNIVISSTGVPTNNISVTSADLTVSTLSNIAISSGLISPAFSSGTTTYTVKVPADVSSTTVTGTATSSAASISNNGTAISTGTPSVILGCTSHDNSSTTNYTVNFANYTFTDWAANGDQTSTSASLPSTYGWKCTNIGSPNTVVNTWNNYGTQGSCRYNDVAGAYTYNSVSFTARKLWIRWNG